LRYDVALSEPTVEFNMNENFNLEILVDGAVNALNKKCSYGIIKEAMYYKID